MICRSELKTLQQHRDYPSVSILAPTHRTAPLNKKDPIKVKNLVSKAVDRLHGEFSKREAAPVVKQLKQLAKDVDWKHTLDGLAIFASRDQGMSINLPFKVKPRAIIDETFATRDVAYAYNRAQPYRVLALSHRPRLFDAWTTVLEERLEKPFPMEYRAGQGKKLSRRQLMNRTSARDDDQRKFFRELDDAVSAVQKADPRPLVITGVDRNLAFYREATQNLSSIVGMLTGNHDQTSPDKLGKLVLPVFEIEATRSRADALLALDQAVDAQRHTSGIAQVWRAAVRGQCQSLFVEKDFVYPAMLSADGDQLLPYMGKGAANLDDAVDEIIEHVMNAGGTVYMYANGDLDEHQRIAAILRM